MILLQILTEVLKVFKEHLKFKTKKLESWKYDRQEKLVDEYFKLQDEIQDIISIGSPDSELSIRRLRTLRSIKAKHLSALNIEIGQESDDTNS